MRIDIPIAGLNAATRRLELRANNVANANTPGYRALKADGATPGAVAQSDAPGAPAGSNVDLAEEQVGSLLDVRAAQANADVVRVEDELLGETLDLLG